MAQPDDENIPPSPAPPSAFDSAMQDHPIAALLGALIVGVLLAKIAF